LLVTVAITLAVAALAEDAVRKPGVVRVDELTVACQAEPYCEVVNWVVPAGLDMPEPP
jgi:hypothetical protein